MSNPNNYSVGWICAITTEYVAARSFLDEEHEGPENLSVNDNNDYTLGKIGKHNVVMAVLPDGEYGISSATSAARDMLHSFPNIRIGLMVGIGGGAPSKKHDIRLGDIVISAPRDEKGGVFQYDFGKTVQEQRFQHTGFLNQPPTVLRTAVSGLRSQYELYGHKLDLTISKILEKWTRLQRKYSRPPPSTDLLYRSDIIHPLEDEESCTVLCGNSPSKLILRPERTKDEDIPSIHYGLIASANQLMKDALIRDTLAAEKDVLCFEMEAAGLMNHFPCLVIRGICDYSDSHKNKAWQGYAAMAAAAYAKDLLYRIPPNRIEAEKRIVEILSDVKERVIDISQNITKIVRKQLGQELQAIIDWLAPIDYASQQNDFIQSRQPGTGEWLVNSEEFQNWINQKKQTLFCPGIPGAGKTIATSIAVNYLHERFQEKRDIGIAYLYLNFRRHSEQEPIHILSSILRQLSQMGSTVHDNVQKLYKKHNPDEEKNRPTSQNPPTRPSLDEIVNTLNQIIAGYSRTYIIIDALDECTDSNLHHSTLMFEIFGLQTRLGVNLFFTSRLVPHIQKYFESRECSTLEICATDTDMRQYLDSNMSQLPAFIFQSNGLEERIKSSIIEASKGMFLLTRLHLDSLRDKISVWQIKGALERLPKGLDAYEQAYKGAMERIRNQKRGFCDLANRVLFWITCSRRPLATLELQHALAVVDGSSALNPLNLPEIGLMVSVCGGLVAVDEQSDIIRLVHYTVQEYFERTYSTWFPTAQTDIAKTCITYLSFDIFKTSANPTDEASEAGLQSNILYDYAACNWGHHVRISSDPDVNLLAVAFLESEATVSTWKQAMQIYQKRSTRYDQEFQNNVGLHIAAYFGLIDPIKTLLEKHDPDSEIKYWTPIFWASLEGHEAVVKLLLENDANPDGWDDKCSPLKLAVHNDHTAVVRLLLEGAANHRYTDYLEHASKTGNIDMAKVLLRSYDHRSDYRNPLLVATQGGHGAMVQLLLDEGFGLESQDENGQTSLQHAAVNGHQAVVMLLLQRGANIESKDENGQTSLQHAAVNGHQAVVRLLLQRGANIESKDENGQTPLFKAVENGHNAILRLLLQKGANIESKDKNGQTPLFKAAKNGDDAISRLLLQNGANLNLEDIRAKTPLIVAIEDGHEAVTKLLLGKGANLEVGKEPLFGTPLIIASRTGDYQMVKLLLENGADPNPKKPEACATALYWAARRGDVEIVRLLLNKGADPGHTFILEISLRPITPLYGAANNGHETVMRLLLESGATLGDKDNWIEPLLYAAMSGYTAVVKLLVENGIDPNSKEEHGFGDTPLLSATRGGHEGTVKLLLQFGVDPNASNRDGTTPLAHSAACGYEAVVKLLLEHGADPNDSDSDRFTPLAVAAKNGHVTIVRLLLEGGAKLEHDKENGRYDTDPLYLASTQPHGAVVKLLLDKGAELEAKHKNGWFTRTPVHYAAYIGYNAMVQQFLEKGADLNAESVFDRTPLYCAIEKGHEQVVGLLLDAGADPDHAPTKLGSPIYLATQEGHTAIVKLLLDKGANPDAGSSIWTPIYRAVREGHTAIVKLLLDRGANPDSCSSIRTPLCLAAKEGDVATATLLLDKGADPNSDSLDGTPLYISVKNGYGAVVKLLLNRGADPDLIPIHLKEPPLYIAATSGREHIPKLLLDNGANPINAAPCSPFSPFREKQLIHQAALFGCEAIVNSLLDKGLSPDVLCGNIDKQQTPLHKASINGRSAVIRLLLEKGADPNPKDNHGHTPLYYAIQGREVASVKLLLQGGADPNIKENGTASLSKFLNSKRRNLVKLFWKRGVSTESVEDEGSTLLHCSAQRDYTPIIRLLLTHNASTEAKDWRGETPLHRAASRGLKVAAKLLLDKGADINSRCNNDDTPLHQAAQNGSEIVVKLLLDRGADVQAKNMAGKTPLHYAVSVRAGRVVKLLLTRGANAHVKDNRGKTPLRNAKSDGQEEIVGLLLRRHGN